MKTKRSVSCLALLVVLAVSAPIGLAQPVPLSTDIFNVRNFGAKGDGVTLDTAALTKAIDTCAAEGGGTVYFPAGNYITGTLHLKSNVTLGLDSGATIRGSKNMADYAQATTNANPVGGPGPGGPGAPGAPDSNRPGPSPAPAGNPPRVFRLSAIIEAENVNRIGIIGNGTIDGNGVRDPTNREERRGAHAVYISNVREFTLRDFTVNDASNYAFLIVGSKFGTIDGVKVYGGWDGIHMRFTSNVTISNCRLYTGDDSLAGWMWQNVVVTNCILSSACHPMRVGGENVTFSNILVNGPSPYPHPPSDKYNTMSAIVHIGVRPAPAGMQLDELMLPRPSDNMVFSGITMTGVRSPMYMAPGACCRWPEGNLGAGLKKIFVNNMTVIGAGKLPLAIVGSPAQNRIESVVFSNVRLVYDGGIEQADGYSVDPSSAFYFENVERVEMNDVHVDYREKDARPVLMAKDVGKLVMNRVVTTQAPENYPLYVAEKVGSIEINGKPAPASAGQVQGLDLDLSRTGGKAVVSEPFNAVVTVHNTGGEGLTQVQLRFGQENLVKSVWLNAKEKRQVLFTDLVCSKAGEYRIETGKFQKTVTAADLPPQQPVATPYQTFSNVKSDMSRRGDTINILAAEGEYYLNQFGGKDSYASVYLKQALHRDGAITVRVDKPHPPARANGMVGIMVKNDIAKAGESAGYVTVQSSIQWGVDRQWSNGYAMEWDADGNGRTDHHTPFDGYTIWPHWLKLERHGAKYTGYYSLDGQQWTKITEVEAPGGNDAEDAGIFATQAGGRFNDIKVVDLSKP